jgi:pilus assembly protein CpaB
MRPKPLILIGVAAVCGLVASIGVSEAIKGRGEKAESELETTKIYVALTQLDIGEPITPQMVKLEPWPTNLVPEDALTKLDEVEKKRPRQPIFPGEPIVTAKLIQGNRDHEIPEGYRVVSVKVDMSTAVSNLLAPGDRVDVLVFLKKSAEIKNTTTRTLLRNVKVFAVNERVDREMEEMKADTIQAKTVSLLVTPKDVEKVMLAAQLGELQLSMRGAGDNSDPEGIDDGETGIAGTFGQQEEEVIAESPIQPGQTDQGPGFPFATAPATEMKESFRMSILDPNGVQQYEAGEDGEMPELVGGSFGAEDNGDVGPVIPDFPTEDDPTAGLFDDAKQEADDAADELPDSLPPMDD